MTGKKVKITNRLRVLRAEREISQEALAQEVGVTRVTINCIERGVYLPSLELGMAIARYFRKAVEDVFITEESHEKRSAKSA